MLGWLWSLLGWRAGSHSGAAQRAHQQRTYFLVLHNRGFVLATTSLEKARARAAELRRASPESDVVSLRTGEVDAWNDVLVAVGGGQHSELVLSAATQPVSAAGGEVSWWGLLRSGEGGQPSLYALFSSEGKARSFMASRGHLLGRPHELYVASVPNGVNELGPMMLRQLSRETPGSAFTLSGSRKSSRGSSPRGVPDECCQCPFQLNRQSDITDSAARWAAACEGALDCEHLWTLDEHALMQTVEVTPAVRAACVQLRSLVQGSSPLSLTLARGADGATLKQSLVSVAAAKGCCSRCSLPFSEAARREACEALKHVSTASAKLVRRLSGFAKEEVGAEGLEGAEGEREARGDVIERAGGGLRAILAHAATLS